jgi:hypothetical protein
LPKETQNRQTLVVHSVVDSLSITSEAIDNLGEYEENVTEKQKDTNIQDRT